ncbi:hypothetical protein [Sulfurovum sp.]|uniref:hypothetical protein n=1 Tax=Sulfurovum sp. TaxID=1969726 RepID=UPI0025FEA88B|nr:hypothetical protein [Sulfurovum sp.]
MKALIILVILATFGIIFFQYTRNRNIKKLLIAIATFGVIISLAAVGNVTRPVIPVFIAHIILLIIAWGGLIFYLIKEKYYWWIMFSPIVTIGLFLLLEFLEGSRHGILG